MLSPFGELIINQRDKNLNDTEDIHEDLHDDDALELSGCDEGCPRPPSMPYMHEGDVEDAMADEAPRNDTSSEIIVQGRKTTKAKVL